MKYRYVDWCPRPTNSSQTRLVSGVISCDEANSWYGQEITNKKVSYHCRNDGILVFQVSWNPAVIDEKSSSDRVSAALVLSQMIKQCSGHVHGYNRKMLDNAYEHPFPTLSVYPVELDNRHLSTFKKVALHLSSDQELVGLQAKSFKYPGEQINPLLLLRNQYAKIFEKSRLAKDLIRNQTFSLFGKNIKAYDYRLMLFILLSVCSFFTFLEYQKGDSPHSISKFSLHFDFSLQSLSDFLDNLLFGFLVVSVPIFVLEVSIKRRKIMKALRRARGFLMYGDIFDGVLNSIIDKSGVSDLFRQCSGFSGALQILEDEIETEKRKRLQSQLWILAGFAISAEYVRNSPVWESFDKEKIYRIFDLGLNFF